MEKEKKCVTLCIREKDDCLYLTNSLGTEWKLPSVISREAALSMLVFDSLYHYDDEVSFFSCDYKISIKVETFDGE